MLRYWWFEPRDPEPEELSAFPRWECYKFIVLREADGTTHIAAGGTELGVHRMLADLAARWRPELAVAGGGLGGAAFPGSSQALGPLPDDVRAELMGGTPVALRPIPAWVRQALAPILSGLSGELDAASLIAAANDYLSWELTIQSNGEDGVEIVWDRGEGRHEAELRAGEIARVLVGSNSSPGACPRCGTGSVSELPDQSEKNG